MSDWNRNLEGIAIIGVAARLPGARSAAEFWENQKNGVEAISHFREDELDVPELTGHFIEEIAVKQVGYLTPEEYARSSHLPKQLRLAK